MGLNAKQKEAVEYLDGPLLVLAGPGTGKTQLLSTKVAYILKNTDTNPENILCLTFTETGASNMRERLRSIAGPSGAKVKVSTYHAFGQDILSEYRNYSPTAIRQGTAVDEIAQFKIMQEIQAALPATDILKGDSVKDILSVISDAKSAGFTASDLAAVAQQNLDDSKILSSAISPLLEKIVPRNFKASLDNAYQPIHDILQKYSQTPKILKNIERSIAGLARDLDAAITEAIDTSKIKPLTAWKDAYFDKSESGTYQLKDRIANKKLQSIANIMATYQDHLRANDLFDFDDMIEEAIHTLATDEGFRLTLSERYQIIMLDEFQDTNPSQFAIVKHLTDYEKPLIMAVGDDDQAIYEFQGALSTNLTDFQSHYDAKVITLVENYRSTQEILDFSSQIIRQAPDRFADKSLTAHKPAPKKSQIHRREFLSSDEEFAFIAKKISELVDSGVPQSEIAVISYKTKYFTPLLPYLKQYPKIKIAYDKRDNLLEDEKIHQLLTIAHLAHSLAAGKKQDSSFTEVLTYPFWDIPTIEAINLLATARAQHTSIIDLLAASENQNQKSLADFLLTLATVSNTTPIESILNQIAEKMRISETSESTQFTFYENLASLKGKLLQHFGDKFLKLPDLIQLIEDYESSNTMIATTSPYRDADEAVQVLTAHKAKGLEFEYVFLISADHAAWGKGKGNNNLLVLPKNMASIRHTGTTDGEKLRILYVAMTRAKSQLIITNSLHDFSGKTPTRLEYLGEYIEKNPETGAENIISPYLPTKTVVPDYDPSFCPSPNLSDFWAKSTPSQAAPLAEKVQNLKNWFIPYTENRQDLRSAYKTRVADYKISATTITSYIDIAYAGPKTVFAREILKTPRDPETESLAAGNLIHKIFEAITTRGITDTEAIELFSSELEKYPIEPQIKSDIAGKWPEYLATALHNFGSILRQGKAEVNLSREHLSLGDIPIVGQIDHIVIDESAKTIEIYDFKTSKYHSGKWTSHPSLYKYMLQLGFYKLLLNNSPTYKKYTVTRGHILFVQPDQDGAVHDKIYEFNEKDEENLTHLIRAIYDQITSLSFIDDQDLFIEPKGPLSMGEITNFIDLVLAKSSSQ